MARAPAAAAVPLSRTGKVLFPDDGIGKGDLVGHYREVAGRMLPHLRGRPLALARYPDGITGQRIFQKNVSPHFPGWVSRTEVGKQGGSVCQVIADSAATLVYLANQACIELHPFLSRVDRLERPDQLIVDLDPPDGDQFPAACRAALAVRDLLAGELGLTCYVKTTGGKGLHVQVPLAARQDFDQVRQFARVASDLLARRHPDLLTTEQRRDQRSGLVYADVMRNGYAQTAVAPFSVRARPGAHVAAPLDWSEVPERGLRPDRFTVRTMPARLAETSGRNDPWSGMSRRRYTLARPAARLARLTD